MPVGLQGHGLLTVIHFDLTSTQWFDGSRTLRYGDIEVAPAMRPSSCLALKSLSGEEIFF